MTLVHEVARKLARGFHAVEGGIPYIHHHNIGSESFGMANGFASIRGLCNHLQAYRAPAGTVMPCLTRGMIVGENNASLAFPSPATNVASNSVIGTVESGLPIESRDRGTSLWGAIFRTSINLSSYGCSQVIAYKTWALTALSGTRQDRQGWAEQART